MMVKLVINQITKIVFLGACALSSFAVLSEQASAESSLYLQLVKERQVRFALVANCTGKDHHHNKDFPDDETAIIALDKRYLLDFKCWRFDVWHVRIP